MGSMPGRVCDRRGWTLAGGVNAMCERWGASGWHMGQCRLRPNTQGSVPGTGLGCSIRYPIPPYLMPPDTPPCLASQLTSHAQASIHNCLPFPKVAPLTVPTPPPEKLHPLGPQA